MCGLMCDLMCDVVWRGSTRCNVGVFVDVEVVQCGGTYDAGVCGNGCCGCLYMCAPWSVM